MAAFLPVKVLGLCLGVVARVVAVMAAKFYNFLIVATRIAMMASSLLRPIQGRAVWIVAINKF